MFDLSRSTRENIISMISMILHMQNKRINFNKNKIFMNEFQKNKFELKFYKENFSKNNVK